MKTFAIISAAASFVLLTSGAYAQDAATNVEFKMTANMLSLKDPEKKDAFGIKLADKQVQTQFDLVCQAGRTKLFVMKTNRGCQISGNGVLLAPNGSKVNRTQYLGGLMVEGDGTTDATALKVNYLAAGKAPAASSNFNGSLNLKPELTSSGAQGLVDRVLTKVQNADGGLIDKRVDTIDLNRFTTASAGLASDKGCSWNGNMVYAYQTESWYIDVTGNCDGKEYKLKGNMPYKADAAKDGESQYTLTLTLPGADAVGDDALFASAADDSDLFASVDGISGTINMKESNKVTVKVDGADEELASTLDATGTFTGTNVPLPVVRSFVTVLAVNASGIFGG